MADCNANNNPDKFYCPGDAKRLFIDQEDISYRIEHQKNSRDTITVGGIEIVLRSRVRDFLMTTQRGFNFVNPEACEFQDQTAAYLIHDGTGSVVTATFSEHYQIIDSEIIYLDTRNRIAVWREVETLMEFSQTSGESILWNQYGSTFLLHDFHFSNLPFTTTTRTRLLVNGVVTTLHESETNASAGELHIALPPFTGTPQNNVPQDYYLFQDHWYDDGGYDLYFPEWLRGLTSNEAVDLADRNEHRRICHESGELANGSTSQPSEPLCDPFPQGSWAVDNGGDIFISQLHPGGVYNKLINADGSEEDIITLTEMADKGDNPVFYPIAPV